MHNHLTWAEIDLDAIGQNASYLKRCAGPNAQLMVTVKANAYGHGMVPVARAALSGGASWLAVHRTSEGVTLRRAGITAPILLMGHSLPVEAESIVRWGLSPTVITREQAQALSEAAAEPNPVAGAPRRGPRPPRLLRVPIHVKVDTGMGRFGLLPHEVVPFVRYLSQTPGLAVEGLYTHFAAADSPDKDFTHKQFRLFMNVVDALEADGLRVPIKHVANSAATIELPEMALEMVRCGIALYGLDPANDPESALPIRAALTLKSQVARVRTLPKGASVSYGRTFIANHAIRVALVPVGYGDGYHRLLSNRGAVLIRGQRAPILGRVCMDQFVVDVTHIPDVGLHDEIVLIGEQGDERISAEEISSWAETINYEVTTSLLPRVMRVFLRDGQEVHRTGLR